MTDYCAEVLQGSSPELSGLLRLNYKDPGVCQRTYPFSGEPTCGMRPPYCRHGRLFRLSRTGHLPPVFSDMRVPCVQSSACLFEAAVSYSEYSGVGIRSGFFSRSSVSVASVNSNVLATETAFSSATRTTLVASMMPASIKSTYLQVEASRPHVSFAGSHAINHHTAVQRRVFGDLTCGRLERSFKNPQTGLFVLFSLGLLGIYGIDRTQ